MGNEVGTPGMKPTDVEALKSTGAVLLGMKQLDLTRVNSEPKAQSHVRARSESEVKVAMPSAGHKAVVSLILALIRIGKEVQRVHFEGQASLASLSSEPPKGKSPYSKEGREMEWS